MAKDSYFATRKKEYDDKIKDALAYEEQKKENDASTANRLQKEHEDRINNALAYEEQRTIETLPDTFANFENQLAQEVKFYNSAKPVYGSENDTYKNQRERRLAISDLRNTVNAYGKYLDDEARKSIVSTLDNMEKGYDSYLEIAGLYDSEDSYNKAAERYKEWQDNWGHYAKESDFLEYSSAVDEQTAANAAGIYRYKNLTDEEAEIYKYVLGKYGERKGEEMLSFLKDNINARKGEAVANLLKGIDIPVVEEAAIGLYGAVAGLDQYTSGIGQLFSKEKKAPSAVQYANSEILNSLDGVGKYAYMATNTVGNMLPSIATSYLAGGFGASAAVANGAGSFTMAASASGNAYGQALAEGYNEGQARLYGTLVGASEGALQYFIGGIGALGGITDDLLLAKVSMIDNSLLRVATKLGVGIGSEIVEEELQLYLEPVFKSFIMGEDYDAPTLDEMVETAIVTAMSTGMLEGGSTIATDVHENRQLVDTGRSVMEVDGGVAELVNLASEMSGASAKDIQKSLTKQSGKVSARMEAGKTNNTTARQVGRLYDTVQTATTAQNKADIVKSLTRGENGLSNRTAAAIAEAMVAQSSDQELSRKQSRVLQKYEGNEHVQNAEQNIVANENSTMGQRSEKLHSFVDRVNNGLKARTAVDSAHTTPPVAPADGATEIKETHKIAEDGVTRQVSTGNAVTPVSIANISEDGFTVRVKGGSEISDGDIAFESVATDQLWRTASRLKDIFPSSANMIINGKSLSNISTEEYISTAHGLYMSGYHNLPISEKYSGKLRSELETMIYNAGKKAAGAAVAKQQSMVQTKADAKIQKTGGVFYGYEGSTMEDRKKNGKKLSKMQAVATDFTQRLADSRGITSYFYESDVDGDGNRVYKNRNGDIVKAENGFYDSKDGSIHIDLNAGSYGRGSVLFTVAHELTHFIQDWSPKHYKKLCNILMKGYAAKGQSVDELVANQQAFAKEHGRELSWDEAYDEVIADSMESILADGKVMELMRDIEATDKTLGDKVKKFFQDICNLLKKTIQAYTHVKPDSEEGRMVQGMQDIYDQLQQVFAEGLYEGGDNYRKAEKNTTDKGGVQYSINRTQSMSWQEQIDGALYGGKNIRRNDTLVAGNSANTLVGVEINNKPLAIPLSILTKASNGKDISHSIKRGKLAKLDKGLQNAPIVIVNPARNAIVYVTDIRQGGLPIVAAFDMNSTFDGDDVHKATSIHLQIDVRAMLVSLPESATVYVQKNELDPVGATNNLRGLAAKIKFINKNVSQNGKTVKENDSAKSDKVKMSARKGETAEKALSHFGRTFSWKETGYLLTDGAKLDFSGRHEGASGGYRSVDHREILDAYPEDTEFDGNGAMVDFMSQGNIRIMPEGNGINLQLQPTKAQEQALGDFISRARGEVTLDIDDANGNTVVSVEYPKGTYYSKVLQDIRNYFTDGTEPTVSPLAQFRFSARKGENNAAQVVLEQENAQLKENVSHLKELLKVQRTVTNGTKFTKTSVEAAARMLKKNANAKGDTAELTKLLHSFYEHIATYKELTWESVKENAQPVVDWLQDHVNLKPQRSEYAQDILSQLHGSRIYLDDTQKAEAAHRYGSFETYRRSMMGTVIISKDAKTSLDSLWQELSAMYPDIFDSETTAADQPLALSDAVYMLRNSDTSALEYEYNREFIAMDLLQQVYDSYWRVSAMRTFADVKQAQINRLQGEHFRRMSKLREDNQARIQQLKDEHRTRLDSVRKEYRAQAEKKQKEITERYQESRRKAIESREKTTIRHKIQRVVGDLNDLLLHEDKKHHVPDSLKKAVADALSLVNMDTVGAEERAAKYAALIAKETDPDKIDAYTVTMENILRQGEKMGERLKELRDAYEDISTSDDPDIANGYDPVISASLKELAESIGNTSLRDMSIDQLHDVYAMYKMVLTRVRDANKSLIDSIKETIADRASRVVGEVRKVGGEHKVRASALDPVRAFSWNNLKPIYAMERIGSATMTEAYNNVRKGEETWAQDVEDARSYYIDKSKKYGYDSWDFDKKYHFKSVSEQEFDLTLEQIMSLYAYSKRNQAGDHLRLGGFVFDSNIETYKEDGKKLLKYKVNTADAHQVSPEILAQITASLTKEQMAFVDEMQDYLSTTMGAKGNEVTMKMYGVKLFKEKFYFPLKSAKQFMFEQNEVSGEVRIKNSGFTNKTTPKANNPVILNNFMDVWANHVNDMSMYHAFVLPLEDFNRIFNYNSPKQEGKPPVSVKGTIQSAYSPSAVSYVKQLITDLNGGAMADPRETFAKSMTAKFKKAKVFSSLSVVIQQPSAIGRAFAQVNPKYFRPTKDGMNHDQLWQELKQYAPVAVIKEMGYFDTNMGRSTIDFIKAKEYTTFKEKAKGIFTDSGYRNEVLSRAPALADELAWCSIWNAVKRETVAKHHDLSPRSEKFLKIAGERFTEVITKTQVYDSVLARSANMRSKSGLMSMVTSFMAEPTTAINMLEDAVRKAKRGDKGYAARAFASVAVSVILNNALVALVYGGRDDDEDETYAEKYAQAFVSGILDDINPVTYYPFLKDMWSLLQGYSVERTDMSLMSDFADAIKAIVQAYASDNGDVTEAWWDMAGAVANIGGIPMQNIRRELKGATNFYKTLNQDVNGRVTTSMSMGDALASAVRDSLPGAGWLPGDTKTDKLYDAIISGDTAYANRLKSGYKSENAYHNAVRKALRENDPRIEAAAQAQIDGDPSERVRIAKQIIADGFNQDDVVAAINTVITDMTTKDDSSGTQKAKGFYTVEDFAKELANGDRDSANVAKADIIATAEKNGKTKEEAEESFASSAKNALKELYLAGDISESKAIAALQEYCNVEEDDIYWTLDRWKYENDTGTSDGYGKYNDFHAAVQTGKDLKAVIKKYTDNGVEKKALASQITSHFKPLYREMTRTERAALKGYLLNAYALLGYDRAKKSKDIDKWLED